MLKFLVLLRDWLRICNIPIEGMKLIIEFPERRHADAADRAVWRETPPMYYDGCPLMYASGLRIDRLLGVEFEFRQREK